MSFFDRKITKLIKGLDECFLRDVLPFLPVLEDIFAVNNKASLIAFDQRTVRLFVAGEDTIDGVVFFHYYHYTRQGGEIFQEGRNICEK